MVAGAVRSRHGDWAPLALVVTWVSAVLLFERIPVGATDRLLPMYLLASPLLWLLAGYLWPGVRVRTAFAAAASYGAAALIAIVLRTPGTGILAGLVNFVWDALIFGALGAALIAPLVVLAGARIAVWRRGRRDCS